MKKPRLTTIFSDPYLCLYKVETQVIKMPTYSGQGISSANCFTSLQGGFHEF